MYKVNENIWPQLMYLINNMFIPVCYTNGRDIYPDRVTFARSRKANEIFEPEKVKDVEYFTLNARSLEKSKKVILAKREIIEKVVTDSLFINEVLNFDRVIKQDYTKLFDYVQKKLTTTETTDYNALNNFIVSAYKKLEPSDAMKIASFREYAIKKCLKNNMISEEFARKSIEELPNSSLKLQIICK